MAFHVHIFITLKTKLNTFIKVLSPNHRHINMCLITAFKTTLFSKIVIATTFDLVLFVLCSSIAPTEPGISGKSKYAIVLAEKYYRPHTRYFCTLPIFALRPICETEACWSYRFIRPLHVCTANSRNCRLAPHVETRFR